MGFAGAFLLLILFGLQGIVILQNEETNRLLSGFQRIDTVKEVQMRELPGAGLPDDTEAIKAAVSATQKSAYTFIKSDEKKKICVDGKWYKILYVDPQHNTAILDGPIMPPVGTGINISCDPLKQGFIRFSPGRAESIASGEGQIIDDIYDPNICYHWSSDCHDGECDSICRLKSEP